MVDSYVQAMQKSFATVENVTKVVFQILEFKDNLVSVRSTVCAGTYDLQLLAESLFIKNKFGLRECVCILNKQIYFIGDFDNPDLYYSLIGYAY